MKITLQFTIVFATILFSCGSNDQSENPQSVVPDDKFIDTLQSIKIIESVDQRVENRDFPSVFQAWNKADNLENEDESTTIARHDLIFTGTQALNLEWDNEYQGLSTGFTSTSIENALNYKKALLEKNNNILTLSEVRYRDAWTKYLPEGHEWWMRDEAGNYVYGWKEGGYIRLDLENEEFQNLIAKQAAAIIATGAVDGIFLDWWTESEFLDARIAILKKIREAIGEEALIVLNSNQRKVPNSAPYANGLFMECWDSKVPTAEKWKIYQKTLEWAEVEMKYPRVNLLETWLQNSRDEVNKMRATTSLSLTRSEGYSLFSDPNDLPIPDHLHDWYEFYDAPLGKPIEAGFLRPDNAYQREFSNGTVIYNPMGNVEAEVEFENERKSMASGLFAKSHKIAGFDGDIFIKDTVNNK